METNLKGIKYLRTKLSSKKRWVTTRYNYYECKFQKPDPSPVIPANLLKRYDSKINWCAKAVDALANRLSFAGFDNDNYNLWEIFQNNNKDILLDSAIRSSLISACCFVYISAGEDGYPRLQVIDGKNATGIIDPITNLLKEGYAVLETDDKGNILIEAYFTPDSTTYYYYGDMGTNGDPKEPTNTTVEENPTGYPLLVPVIYRPDAHRPFGQSRISVDCMDLQDKARFTVTRMEVLAEFNAFPQKWILGTAQDSDLDTVKATYTSFLEITKDDDGEHPVIGQFQQATMTPLVDQIKTYAQLFCGITGLTMDDLGFVSQNPSSAESIKAGHGDLEKTASKAQDTFGSGFLNVGFVARCLADKYSYRRNQIFETIPVWNPIYAMDNSALSSFGDAVIKINQAVPDAINAQTMQRLTGLKFEGVE